MCMFSVMFNSLQPHGLQPTRLLCPWDFPGKNIQVGCHFLLQGNFPNPEMEPTSVMSPALAGRFLSTRATCEVQREFSELHPIDNCLNLTLKCQKTKFKSPLEFPSSPVVRTQHFHCWGLGSIPGQKAKILQAVQRSQKK